MSDVAKIPVTEDAVPILQAYQPSFCQALESKFGCTAVIHNLGGFGAHFAPSGAKKSNVPDQRYVKQLPKGLKISVWKDDLTCHQVDAVVNAANEQLQHAGGLAEALCRAGGPTIQQMSDSIIKKRRFVPTGTAVFTPAGNLPCRGIIHAVGPCMPLHPSRHHADKARTLLQKTIRSILQVVERENLRSVAIPAVSSGLFRFPLPLCANVIVTTLKQYHDEHFRHSRGKDLDVRLVNHDEPSVREMERACKEILDEPSESYSHWNPPPESITSHSLNIGSVTLNLKLGAIQKETVDVIVNTTSAALKLSEGQISKAILEKASHKIQVELNAFKKKSVTFGDIFETKGHELSCSAVYHTICAVKSSKQSSTILQKVITDCLERAAKNDISSISFPAIGSGHLGFGKKEVAQIMTKAAVEFARSYNGKAMHINFVLLPNDIDTFEAFKEEFTSMRENATMFITTNTSHDDGPSGRGEQPYVELHAPSLETLTEARLWTQKLLSPPSKVNRIAYVLSNNHVMHFGQKDFDDLLSIQKTCKVLVKVFYTNGRGGINISGAPRDVKAAAIQVEAMSCKALEEFAQAEENAMLHSLVRWQCKVFPDLHEPETNAVLEKAFLSGADSKSLTVNGQELKINFKNMTVEHWHKNSTMDRICFFSSYAKETSKVPCWPYYGRKPVTQKNWSLEEQERVKSFEKQGFKIVTMDKVENVALKQLFELSRKRVTDPPQTLYQCVSAQFCNLISRVGFQREYAPPREQKYGAGIYFSTDVRKALEICGDREEEEYLYFVQAQVALGNNVSGSADMILPPSVGDDPLVRYDSVTGDRGVYVIFNGHQALPEYLFTCSKI